MPHLTDLETVVTWEGAIDNERIRQLLGVKAVWASRLLGELTKKIGRRGHRASAYAPLELTDLRSTRRSPDEYLRVVSAQLDQSANPLVEDARLDLSPVSPGIFATVFRAAKAGVGIKIVYRSMTSPKGTERVVFPHALVRAPRRWHMRAWCDQRQDYRDFTLGRIAAAERLDTPSVHGQANDTKWNRMLELVVVAHPALTIEQQDMIGHEYFPGAKALRVRVRECLAAYAVQDLRLALDPAKHTPPDYQLLVNNAAKLPPLFATEAPA